MRLLLGEDLAYAATALGRTEPLGGRIRTPGERLNIQIIEITETTRGEECFAGKPDGAFHLTFLVPPCDRYRPGLEAVVAGQLKQRRMEADRLADALEHGAFEIVVECRAGDALEMGERLDMSADEVRHRGAEIEAQKQMARVGEHHHKGHQRTHRAADGERAEM